MRKRNRTHSRLRNTFSAIMILSSMVSYPSPARGMEGVTVEGATYEEEALVEWAMDQYDLGDIDVRPITVIFHPKEVRQEPCNGAVAYYYGTSRTVHMCNSMRPMSEQRHWILHELGHAYTLDIMEEADIEAFVHDSQSDSWNNRDDNWPNRGQERAADIVAWGLNPDPAPIYWMQEIPCEERVALFFTLTGVEIAHDEC